MHDREMIGLGEIPMVVQLGSVQVSAPQHHHHHMLVALGVCHQGRLLFEQEQFKIPLS